MSKRQFCCFWPYKYCKANNTIKINNELINLVGKYKKEDSVKFLGLYIDKYLTWKEHINIISSKIARTIFAINRVKLLMPHKTLKSLYYALIHSHVTYIQAWGIGNTRKFLQKRALRIIKNKGYRSYTDPIFKSGKIFKVLDLYKLQVSLLMYDFHHDLLPKLFLNVAIKKNVVKSIRTTRQYNLLVKERPRTNFSSKFPKYNFTIISNNIDDKIRNVTHRSMFKHLDRECN